ncbi:MAG: bifunctional 5,10-methylenetetrahydrofolate dehydrogenase/5,10-methenyltetrahydrofolate cyclohydrolase [Brevinema sp.]
MILDGNSLAASEKQNLAMHIKSLSFKPGLATILVGDDSASRIYVQSKIRSCDEVGIASYPIFLPENTTTEEIIACISKLNSDADIHAILVQLPLPPTVDTSAVILSIDPKKDVDCFHPTNLGRLFNMNSFIKPCTPMGILQLIGTIPHFSLVGTKSLIIGAGNIVGKPMSLLLLQEQATIAVAHKQTKNLKELTLWADVIISATGSPRLVKADMVKEGCVIIDVGIFREGKKIVGDCDFENIKDKARAITPVPGGVGPMTIINLLKNTVILAELNVNTLKT